MTIRAAVAAVCVGALVVAGDASAQSDQQFPLLTAWYAGIEFEYYDLGTNTPPTSEGTVATAPVWVLTYGMNDDGTLKTVDGQRSIFDVRPGDPGYSDLWQVTAVTVPEDYEPNSIRSAEEIEASGFPVQELDRFVNCPFVPEDASLEGGEQVALGWVNGEDVFYVDFGPAPNKIGQAWVLAQDASLDDSASLVRGRRMIFDSVPGDDQYSAFRWLNLVPVPEGYDTSSIESVRDLVESGLSAVSTGIVRNMPVVHAGGAEPPGSAADRGYQGSGRSPSPILRSVVFSILALGGLAVAGALLVARGRSTPGDAVD